MLVETGEVHCPYRLYHLVVVRSERECFTALNRGAREVYDLPWPLSIIYQHTVMFDVEFLHAYCHLERSIALVVSSVLYSAETASQALKTLV